MMIDNRPNQTLLRGTAVAIEDAGILLRGPSGAGKSDLALRLIDGGAQLVSDDFVLATRQAGQLMLGAAPNIEGQLEVRGIGILCVEATKTARLSLAVDLQPAGEIERLPDQKRCSIFGINVARIALCPFDLSAAAKLRMIVSQLDRVNDQAQI